MNDADSKKLEETPYPIQDGPTIPWSVIAPHEAQCKRNHGQSLKRLAERGGLGAAEAYCVVKGLSLDAFREYGSERLRAWWWKYAESVNGSKAQLTEQDREIERLLAYVDGNDKDVEIGDLEARVKEQDREIKELQLGKEAAERLNRMNVKVADGETDRADKAEARIKELKEGLEEQAKLWDMAEQDLETAADCHRQVAFHVEHQPAEKARLLAEKEKVK